MAAFRLPTGYLHSRLRREVGATSGSVFGDGDGDGDGNGNGNGYGYGNGDGDGRRATATGDGSGDEDERWVGGNSQLTTHNSELTTDNAQPGREGGLLFPFDREQWPDSEVGEAGAGVGSEVEA